ncbi:MAG: hypothetical protein R3F60_04670 [bacterium]
MRVNANWPWPLADTEYVLPALVTDPAFTFAWLDPTKSATNPRWNTGLPDADASASTFPHRPPASRLGRRHETP